MNQLSTINFGRLSKQFAFALFVVNDLNTSTSIPMTLPMTIPLTIPMTIPMTKPLTIPMTIPMTITNHFSNKFSYFNNRNFQQSMSYIRSFPKFNISNLDFSNVKTF